MNIRDRRGLKQDALSRLSGAEGNPRKLVLIHTAVTLGAALLVAVVTFLLQQKIGTTGGLSGIGLRTALTTAQSLLQILHILIAPFWQVAMIWIAIRFARSQRTDTQDLTAGFRLFGPVFRLKLGQILLFIALAIPCAFVTSGIFMMTPLSYDYVALMEPFYEQAIATGQVVQMDAATAEAMTQALFPVIPIYLLVYGAVLLPIAYRMRMAEYLIMDGKTRSGLFAMIGSFQMTRGESFALLRLDLSFWWFYLLSAAAVVIGNGDTVLSAMGVTLPFSAEMAYFLFYGIYIIAQLALSWFFVGYVQTTYAVAYEQLAPRVKILQLPPPPWEQAEN